MKVLFDHSSPFLLAHGGFQIQIEQTKTALEAIGVEVDYLRWWDAAQTGDLIHFFGRPTVGYVEQAQGKGIRVVVSDLLTGLGSRSLLQRVLQKKAIRAARTLLPADFTMRQGWAAFDRADALIALTPWEARLLVEMFGASSARVHVVPNGVEKVFFEKQPEPRGPWLICTATITERKRVLETADAAVAAKVPLWAVGKPYSDNSLYFRRLIALRERHPDLIRFEGPIDDRRALARAYRQARGFVLLSTMESLSLSALEAAACECPLLLSDLPWARTVFGQHAQYCSASANGHRTAVMMRNFYDRAPMLALPPKPLSWKQVAEKLKEVYVGLLSTSE